MYPVCILAQIQQSFNETKILYCKLEGKEYYFGNDVFNALKL